MIDPEEARRSLMRHAWVIVGMQLISIGVSWLIYRSEPDTGWLVHLGSLISSVFAIFFFCVQGAAWAFHWLLMRGDRKRPGEFIALGAGAALLGMIEFPALPFDSPPPSIEPAIIFSVCYFAGWLALTPALSLLSRLFTLRSSDGTELHGEKTPWKFRFTIRNLFILTTIVAAYCGWLRIAMEFSNRPSDQLEEWNLLLLTGPLATMHVVAPIALILGLIWSLILLPKTSLKTFAHALMIFVLITGFFVSMFLIMRSFDDWLLLFLLTVVVLIWHIGVILSIKFRRGWHVTFRPWEKP